MIRLNWLRTSLCAVVLLSLGCDRTWTKTEGNATDSKAAGSTSTGDPSLSKTSASTESPPATPSTDEVKSATSAKLILEECIAKYKSINRYEDAGRIRVRIPFKDKPVDETEVMRVAYEAPNRLAIQSIDLQACWKTSTWEAVVGKDDFRPFGNQRLARPRPDRMNLDWLLRDHLGMALENRATGVPIQLQLLLDPSPLSYMLDKADSKLTLLKPESFDSHVCDRVQVKIKEVNWVFWVDQKDRLLRKYELPVELLDRLEANLPKDLDKSKMELSVELIGAKANAQAIQWFDWQLPSGKDELLVRRFIEAPPSGLSPMLGKEVPKFDLKNAEGKVILDSAQRTKLNTVLCWIDDSASSEQFVNYLTEVYRAMEKSQLSSAFDLFLLTNVKQKPMELALKKWNCDLPIAFDLDNSVAKQFSVQRPMTIAVLDKQSTVQHLDELGYLDTLPDVIAAIRRGVKPAERLLQTNLHNIARFRSRLHRALIDKSQVDELGTLEEFPFTFHSMEEGWHVSFDENIVAASSEWDANGSRSSGFEFGSTAVPKRIVTVLDDQGTLYTIDTRGAKRPISKIPLDRIVDATQIQILPDPWTHDWIAIVPQGLSRYWLIENKLDPKTGVSDTSSIEPIAANELPLEEGELVDTVAWTGSKESSHLVIATSTGRLLVIDPVTGKAKKGKVTDVTGLIPALDIEGNYIEWSVVDSTGALNPIEGLIPRPSDTIVSNEGKVLPMIPERGLWFWGRAYQGPALIGMARLPSGEFGTALYNRSMELISTHPLSVRAEHCKLHSLTTMPNGALYWLSTAPRRVLHLQTLGSQLPDQMCLGKPILSAGIYAEPKAGNEAGLRMITVVDREVSSWKLGLPPPPVGSSAPTAQP